MCLESVKVGLKGKSAIQIARKFGARQKNFTGEHFWARGYFVSTVELEKTWFERTSGIRRTKTSSTIR